MHDPASPRESRSSSPIRPGQRADARRNHQKVVAAAHEVFSEHGLQASMTQVAERAGVTKATIYRNYPTKEALINAVTRHQFRLLESRTRAALSEPDAYEAFAAYIIGLFEWMAHDRLLADALSEATVVSPAPAIELISQLIDAAKPSGKLRPDTSAMDFRVLVCGAVLQLNRLGNREPSVWRRYGDMTLAALRPWPEARMASACPRETGL
ncbi:TetR/AcrR family transcriptional regulator [Microbispora bryophytorum]|uniref:TetR/AcrR family transcriptional regulator n=1 Tax=Microbispora bryophytorum subsp. camponoti TaxID=1677852 RepID=A0ABR8LE37_9ACTN|nr:TetR/AcrR family transcriptional regulator [Microbispora camponoti]MBD3148069.1 TetR/AcrR family transcriptional regulator [Microbispora camponoti]